MIDLGRWLDESYSVSREEPDDEALADSADNS